MCLQRICAQTVVVAAVLWLWGGRTTAQVTPEPGDADSLYRRALELADGGKTEEAAAAMMRALRALPSRAAAKSSLSSSAESHIRQGIRHARLRHDSLAEKEFNAAIEKAPDCASARFQLAFLLGNRGEYRGMFRELWRAARLDPSSPDMLRAVAGLALLAGETAEAAECYREFLKKMPSSPEVMRMLGLILVEGGDGREGFSLLEGALAIEPEDYSTLSSIGLAHALAGDYRLSEKYLKRAIELNRSHHEATGRLGMVFLLQGRTEESIQMLREALDVNPDAGEIIVNLAKAYKMAGRLDEADAQYSRALAADPSNHEAWYERGNILILQGKTDTAFEAYAKAAALKPDLAKAHYKMGLILARKREYAEAQERFKATLRADCDYADAYYALAVINRDHMKEWDAAAHYYRMYLLYDSSSERAREAVRWLERRAEERE